MRRWLTRLSWWWDDYVLYRWSCGDCGAYNSRRYDWCQAPHCRTAREGGEVLAARLDAAFAPCLHKEGPLYEVTAHGDPTRVLLCGRCGGVVRIAR